MKEFEPKSLAILGRQPALGLAELENLFGAEHLRPLPGVPVEYSPNSTKQAVLLDIPAGEINFKRLGGTLKIAQLLDVLPSSDWRSAYDYLASNIPKHLQQLPAPTPQGRGSDPDNESGRRQDRQRQSVGKGTFTLGVSVYGLNVNVKKLSADLFSLKKIIRASGRSVRIVPNKTLELNSAQVLHNKLTRRGAWELLLVRVESKTYLAQTLFVQDIEAYAARDQARPKRDARVGMLPPKLAQILINLAVGRVELTADSEQLTVKKPETNNSQLKTTKTLRLLDPFCGTGVVLQEALLMGYHVIGTDIDPRMVDYAKGNIQWLIEKYPAVENQVVIEVADATTHHWPRFSAVASELYLGRPLGALPQPNKLKEIVRDVNTITKKFLTNLAPQLKPGQKVVLAIPAWRSNVLGLTYHMWHLPVVDRLTDMGYNRKSFVHVKNDELIYFRQDQIVARELLVLEARG